MALIELPSITSVFTEISSTSQPTLDEFIPIAAYFLGITIGILLIIAIVVALQGGMHNLIGMFHRDPSKKYD